MHVQPTRGCVPGFRVSTNVELTPASVETLRALARERGIGHVQVFCRKQLREALDSTPGMPIRHRYLGIDIPTDKRSDFERQQSQAKEEERLRRAATARHLAQRYARPYRASDLIRTLNDIARRVTRAARKFDDVTRRMARAVPPSDGFYSVKVLSRRECSIYPVGKSALSGVVVRIVDLDQEPADPFGRVVRIGRLKPLHGAVLDLGVDWMQRCPRSVDVYFTARHGAFTQEIRGCHLPNGDWSWASRTQTASGKLVDLDVPEGFPVKEVGIEDWLPSVPSDESRVYS